LDWYYRFKLKSKKNVVYLHSENTKDAEMKQVMLDDITKDQFNIIEKYLINKYGVETASQMMPKEGEETKNAEGDGPVELKSRYIYNTSYNYSGYSITGKFSITLDSVKTLTLKEARDMGYDSFTNTGVGYRLINITLTADEVKTEVGNVIGGQNGINSIFKGSEVPSYDYINVVYLTDSFANKIETEFKKDNFSETKNSVIITDNVILPIINGEKNYMVFTLPTKEGNSTMDKYFKID
jgi:hypothetical protein